MSIGLFSHLDSKHFRSLGLGRGVPGIQVGISFVPPYCFMPYNLPASLAVIVPFLLEFQGLCSNLFTVLKPTGGVCPLLELKVFYTALQFQKFWMELARSVIALLKQGDFLGTIAIKDVYFIISISPCYSGSCNLWRVSNTSSLWLFTLVCLRDVCPVLLEASAA